MGMPFAHIADLMQRPFGGGRYRSRQPRHPAFESGNAPHAVLRCRQSKDDVNRTAARIGDAEKTQWLPYYYAGLALTIPAWADTKMDKDANSERIKALCDKADALTNENSDKSEILAIRNMAATQQMLVDPQNRYMTYGAEGAGYLTKAKALDPENPRLAYLEGAGIFGTPEQFGGGKDAAKPLVQKAVDLAKAEQVKPLYPHWSLEQSEEVLASYQ